MNEDEKFYITLDPDSLGFVEHHIDYIAELSSFIVAREKNDDWDKVFPTFHKVIKNQLLDLLKKATDSMSNMTVEITTPEIEGEVNE